MRTYWLQAELSGEKWDMGPYGLAPFLPTKRELTRGITFDKTSDYTFLANGEDYKQPTFVGDMVFKGANGITGFERYRRFVDFVAANTTKNFRNLYKNAFYTGGVNAVKKLRLYSKESKWHERFCYVSLQNITAIRKMGQDLICQVTFSMQSLWLIQREIPFSKIKAGTSTGSGDVQAYTVDLTADDFGDTDIIVGVETKALAKADATAVNVKVEAYSTSGAVMFVGTQSDSSLSFNPVIQSRLPLGPIYKYEANAFIIGEKFGQYICAGRTNLAGLFGSYFLDDTYEAYKCIDHTSTAKLKVTSYVNTLKITMPKDMDGRLFWYKKYFGE